MKTLSRRLNSLESAAGMNNADRLTIWTCWFSSPVTRATCNGRYLERRPEEKLDEFMARAEAFFPWPKGSSLRLIAQDGEQADEINRGQTPGLDSLGQ